MATAVRRSKRSQLRGRAPEGPLPDAPVPMLASLAAEPFDHPDWIFEPKFDGLRVLVRFDGEEVTLISRNGHSQNVQFPDMVRSLDRALSRPTVLDGEVVCFDDKEKSSFRAIQQRFHLLNRAEIERRAEAYPAFLHLFDILYFDRFDVTGLPLGERKEILHSAVRWSDRLRETPFKRRSGVAEWKAACRQGEEGIIGKDWNSLYVPGRGAGWLKFKCVGRQEVVIGGFTEPQRSRVGLGAILVGYYDDMGRLTYAGKVGTGYTQQTLLDLRALLDREEVNNSPFAVGDPPRGRGVHWVRPKYVAEIGFAEWTDKGLLRQPRFEGLRTDKHPREIRRERPVVARRTRKG